jgi:hypothetical protein
MVFEGVVLVGEELSPPSKSCRVPKTLELRTTGNAPISQENGRKSCSRTVFGNPCSDKIVRKGLRNAFARQRRKTTSPDDYRRPCRFTYLCVREPIRAKTYVSVLHAILCVGFAGDYQAGRGAAVGPPACIARKVIPRVRPPVCCVQYGVS